MWTINSLKTEAEFADLGRAVQAGLTLWATLTAEGYAQVPDLPAGEMFVIPPLVPDAFLTVVSRPEIQAEYQALQEADEPAFPDALAALREKVGYVPLEQAAEEVLDELIGELAEKGGDPEDVQDDQEEEAQEAEAPVDDPELVEVEINESATLVYDTSALAEADTTATAPTAPIWLKIRLIKPGWGNKRDNHYYSPDVLRKSAKMFENAPMYLTDHVPTETNVRNLAGHITRVDEFDDDGAPVGLALIHKPEWAAHVRNMATDPAVLASLPVSIRAKGLTRAYKDGARIGREVAEFTDAFSVDFVTRAGAGGGVVGLSETAIGTLIPQDVPQPVRARVLAGQYDTEEAVAEALDRELHYLQEATGALRPVAAAPQKRAPQKQSAYEQAADRKDAVLEEFGFFTRRNTNG